MFNEFIFLSSKFYLFYDNLVYLTDLTESMGNGCFRIKSLQESQRILHYSHSIITC